MNGKEICVSDQSVLDQSFIMPNFPTRRNAIAPFILPLMRDFVWIRKRHTHAGFRCGRIMLCGGVGRFEIFIEAFLGPWILRQDTSS